MQIELTGWAELSSVWLHHVHRSNCSKGVEDSIARNSSVFWGVTLSSLLYVFTILYTLAHCLGLIYYFAFVWMLSVSLFWCLAGRSLILWICYCTWLQLLLFSCFLQLSLWRIMLSALQFSLQRRISRLFGCYCSILAWHILSIWPISWWQSILAHWLYRYHVLSDPSIQFCVHDVV